MSSSPVTTTPTTPSESRFSRFEKSDYYITGLLVTIAGTYVYYFVYFADDATDSLAGFGKFIASIAATILGLGSIYLLHRALSAKRAPDGPVSVKKDI